MKQICVFLLFFSMAAFAEHKQSLSITLENADYPDPLNFFSKSRMLQWPIWIFNLQIITENV